MHDLQDSYHKPAFLELNVPISAKQVEKEALPLRITIVKALLSFDNTLLRSQANEPVVNLVWKELIEIKIES